MFVSQAVKSSIPTEDIAMPVRTVKGPVFTLIVDGRQIVVKHVNAKGKRCRVFAPDGVLIETGLVSIEESGEHSSPKERLRLFAPQVEQSPGGDVLRLFPDDES